MMELYYTYRNKKFVPLVIFLWCAWCIFFIYTETFNKLWVGLVMYYILLSVLFKLNFRESEQNV